MILLILLLIPTTSILWYISGIESDRIDQLLSLVYTDSESIAFALPWFGVVGSLCFKEWFKRGIIFIGLFLVLLASYGNQIREEYLDAVKIAEVEKEKIASRIEIEKIIVTEPTNTCKKNDLDQADYRKCVSDFKEGLTAIRNRNYHNDEVNKGIISRNTDRRKRIESLSPDLSKVWIIIGTGTGVSIILTLCSSGLIIFLSKLLTEIYSKLKQIETIKAKSKIEEEALENLSRKELVFVLSREENLTQKEIADKVKTSQSTVSRDLKRNHVPVELKGEIEKK